MNQTFNLKRFGMLFTKHTVENMRSYGMSVVVFFGILTVGTMIANYHSAQPHQVQWYMIFLIAAGTIFTSTIFANLGEKRKTIAALTLPASSLEKFLVGWIYSYILFLVIYTGLYYLLMIAVLKFGHWPPDAKLMNVFDPESKIYFIFVAFTILHAIVIYGAIAFKKMHFIKTAFALFVIGLPIWLLNNQIVEAMIGRDINGNPPFFGASFMDKAAGRYYNVDLSYDYSKWLITLFLTLSVIIWVAAYFKLKEKQV